ncbi:uncharacterized protein LOC129987628 [Argiope bruennichi]|uniref:uncharacterized protein LOC129987628 n=1 Tax=Argiope bruennichi TaxID=94029 RepID=UPI002493F350|nr:uncharacterized protein LOC129987628 [Argiope bruennichi]
MNNTIYCDNGSNFVGAANYLKQLDWNRIQKYGAINSIDWKFNSPTAAWWGGWWERLIRILKDLLKKVLGQGRLNYEEMITVLADCERVINSRPLTYICEEGAIKPISPSMFIQDVHECNLPDIDAVEQNSVSNRFKYRQAVLKDLRNRFRSEYLGRITKIIPGKDGHVRLVRVQTSQQNFLRPIQRIYPLELTSSDDFSTSMTQDDLNKTNDITKTSDSTSGNEMKFSRAGRRIKLPEKLNLKFILF